METPVKYNWTTDKYHELIEKGILTEEPVQLVDGEIIQLSPEGIEHIYTTSSLADYLRSTLQGRATIFEAHPVTLANSEPEPDITILRYPKQRYRSRKPIASDIHWLIEIAKTTLDYDLEVKAPIYARNEIAEYWIVDLKNNKVIVLTQPFGDRYQLIAEYSDGVITSIAFPETEIPVAEILLY